LLLLLLFFIIVIVIVIVVKSVAAGGVSDMACSGGCKGRENMGPTALSVDASRDAFDGTTDPAVISGPISERTPTVDT